MPEISQNFQLNGNHIKNLQHSRPVGTVENEASSSIYFTPRKTLNIVKKMNVPDQSFDVWGNVQGSKLNIASSGFLPAP